MNPKPSILGFGRTGRYPMLRRVVGLGDITCCEPEVFFARYSLLNVIATVDEQTRPFALRDGRDRCHNIVRLEYVRPKEP